MEEMILTWPNVTLQYCDIEKNSSIGDIREVEKGKWGYRLTVGQRMQSIRYRGTNHDIHVQPWVREIREDGLVIQKFLKEPEFIPFVKSLSSGGVWEPREFYVVPCIHLFEKNKMEDIVQGNVNLEEEGFVKDEKRYGYKGYGMWYQHGGWRTVCQCSDQNLRNFIPLGQTSLFEKGLVST